jgi:hypothetical protein
LAAEKEHSGESGECEKRLEMLVHSLELVTARMIESIVVNSQLASSQTPQIREMFDTWIRCMSDEVARFFDSESDVPLEKISEATGLPRESVLTLLTALDRSGKISIRKVTAGRGTGKNSDICDCLTC